MAAAVLVVAAAGGAAAYLLLRTKGSPQQTAASYLRDWQRGDYAAMDAITTGLPRAAWPGRYARPPCSWASAAWAPGWAR